LGTDYFQEQDPLPQVPLYRAKGKVWDIPVLLAGPISLANSLRMIIFGNGCHDVINMSKGFYMQKPVQANLYVKDVTRPMGCGGVLNVSGSPSYVWGAVAAHT
jgi:hypothetical protein